MRHPLEDILLDRMMSAYGDWRDVCESVRGAYRSWTPHAPDEDPNVGYERYLAALDREEHAAAVYAALARRVAVVMARDLDARELQATSGRAP